MDALRAAYPGRIPLHLSQGVAYLWEPQDAALLIDESQAYIEPTDEERAEFWAGEDEKIQQQKKRTLAQQREQREKIEAQLQSRDGNGALERRAARQAAKANHVVSPTGAEGEQGKPLQDDDLERMPYVHYTPGSSAHLPGYQPCTAAMQASVPNARINTYTTLQEAYAANVWTYPRTLEERARCAVFEDLHSKGYFLSTGLRFGGDFVVYPGDPLRYHSHYTAAVLPTPETPMPAYHIVAAGRLGTAVKKSHLLCQANTRTTDDKEALERRQQGADDDASMPWGDVVYWSLAWAGFGT